MEGQTFASHFGVGHTTLLFFDRDGDLVNQHYGTTTAAHLRRVIDGTFASGRTRQDVVSHPETLEAIREKYNRQAKEIIDSMGR